MQVLLKGNTLNEESGMTKRQIQDRLERYQAMQRGEIPLEGDSVTYENLPEVIERWTEYARTAPEDGAPLVLPGIIMPRKSADVLMWTGKSCTSLSQP